jgi:hypothetical protein
MNLRHNQTSQS